MDCSCLCDCDGVLNVPTARSAERCVLQDQKIFSTQEFTAQKKLLRSFVLSREQIKEKEMMRLGIVLLLSGCLTKRENGTEWLEIVRSKV